MTPLAFVIALTLAAQPPADTLRGSVVGVVYDSVARAPLAGAEVQMVPADSSASGRVYSATTDRDGRYRIDNVVVGAYAAGFFHARLDSLGVAMRPLRVDVAANRAARLTLALPSATTVQRQLCETRAISDTTALLVGFVRDAATLRALDSAQVRVEWTELSIGRGGFSSETRGGTVTTRPNGCFALCGVPAGVTVTLRASAGADTSGAVPIEVAGHSVASRSLLVGAGTTRLVGAVHTVTGQPLAGARVSLVGGVDTATTNAAGTFTLGSAAVGSRTLEARAVGFLPLRRVIDVRPDEADAPPTPLQLTLTSFSAYLDTVRVTRQRVYSTDRNGFERRRRASGTGYFFDRERIDQTAAIRVSDLLRRSPGVTVLPNGASDQILMRGYNGQLCSPTIYIDGMLMTSILSGIGSADLDFLANPTILDGVEVYPRGATAPAQFSQVMSGCGSIVFWTRPPDPLPPRPKKEKKPKAAPADAR